MMDVPVPENYGDMIKDGLRQIPDWYRQAVFEMFLDDVRDKIPFWRETYQMTGDELGAEIQQEAQIQRAAGSPAAPLWESYWLQVSLMKMDTEFESG